MAANTEYKYKIRAYKQVNAVDYWGEYSEEVSAKTQAKTLEKVQGLIVETISATSLELSWDPVEGADGYCIYRLNASTGKELQLSATQGGDFFYNFHFQLYGMPYTIGRLIVTIAAFIMLLTLISGIITHKKILTDFFTLRAFKGQRSYLDFHNATKLVS